MESQQFMQQHAPPPPPPQQSELADPDEMQHMWQFLDSTLTTGTTPNGLPPQAMSSVPDSSSGTNSAANMMQQAQYAPHGSGISSAGSVHPDANVSTMLHATGVPPHLHTRQISDDMRDAALNDEDNGMYNELGDVFSMFFNIDSDDSQQTQQQLSGNALAALAHAHAQQMNNGGSFVGAPRYAPNSSGNGTNVLDADAHQKVQLPRSMSSSSGIDSISPGAGFPSMSPATMNWLQSLGKSASSDSLMGLISPATLYGTPGAFPGSAGAFPGSAGAFPGSAGANSLADGSDLLERTPSCEMIDWKAYNEAGEKAQKDTPKWRVIPQHGPHADAASGPSVSGFTNTGLSSKPPTGSSAGAGQQSAGESSATASEGGLRDHFTRQFQTIKSTVVSLVGALAADGHPPSGQFQSTAAPPPTLFPTASAPAAPHQPVLSQSAQEQLELAAKRMAEDKNKRKAIISPEYVQYGASTSSSSASLPLASSGMLFESALGAKPEAAQVASQVPDPSGRRPSKKTLHHTAHSPVLHDTPSSGLVHSHSASSLSIDDKDDPNASAIRCKCTGKCRNARCACVKAGFVCGVHCKCVSCANPFVPMASEGIDIQKMVHDVCLMQFLSKVKDMQELLDSTVPYECCGGEVQVKHTVESGFSCPKCATHYTYSWCSNRLCNDQKKPRKHCAKCRRCGDHRNEHCDECNHCYFAGVANSFSCSCKGGKTGANGMKARAVVPNINRDADGLRTKTGGVLGGASSDSSARPWDENSAPLNQSTQPTAQGTAGASASTTAATSSATIADGLSSAEAEKDDSCPVQ